MVHSIRATAASGINQQINFQGRLLNSSGATVPDGLYNVEFKIYQDGDGLTAADATGSPAGSLKWTEDHLVNTSTGVTVKNGYFSAQLGSVTAFGNNINWNQDTLWLSVNIGGTGTTASYDGEMLPMKRLAASPYALNSNQLGGLTSSQYIQLAQGVQTETGNSTNSLFINKTGTGGAFIDLQAAGTDAFILNNSGDITFGNNANHNISVTTAGAGVAGRSLTLTAGAAGTGGTALAGGDLVLQGGAGGGTNGNGGNITIDAGAKNGTGANGQVNIGNANASAINVATNAAAHTIAIANGAAAQSVTIGSTNTTSSLLLQAGSNGASTLLIQTQGGTLGIGNNAVAQTLAIGNTTGGTTINLQSGTGGINLTGATSVAGSLTISGTNTFSTGTGNVSLQGATTVSAGFTVTNAGNVAFQKGTDYATTGSQNNVNLGTGALIRLTGATAQTLTGITGGVDGRIITLVNTSTTNSATLSYLNASSSAANQINTGTGADLSIPAGGSVSLVYDSGANVWRVIGSSATTGGYIQLQGATPGTAQTGNFNISGVGVAATFQAGNFDTVAAGTLTLGNTNATTINVGTNAAAHTIAIGTDATTTQSITIGSTSATSSLTLQAGSGAGILGIGNGTSAQNIGIGNVNGTTNVTVTCGTGTCAFGAGTAAHTTTIGTTNSTATTNIQGGTGGINVGTVNIGGQTVQIGSTVLTTGNTQTINIGNNGVVGGGTTNVTIGSTIAGTVTLQSAATINVGNNTNAQTVNVGNTTGGTTLNLQAGTGGINLTGATGVTGALTVTGTNTFTSGSGNVSLQGATTVSAGFTVTNAGNVAFQKGTDYSTTGLQNDIPIGTGALVRLTGATAQSIGGIAGGADGRILTLVNAAAQTATIKDKSTSASLAANQISTGTGGDISLPADASLTLVYDSGASKWRVLGTSATTGGYIQLQGGSPGTAQTGNFNISGTGVLNTLSAAAAAALTITANAASTWSTSAGLLTLQGAGGVTVQSAGGTTSSNVTIASGNATGGVSGGISIDNGTFTTGTPSITLGSTNARSITIGNTTGATGIIERVGTGNYSLDGVAGSTYTLGASTTTGSFSIGSGLTSGTIGIGGTGAQTGNIDIGVGTGAQALNFGTGGTGAKTVTVGSLAGAGTTTLQGGTSGSVNIGAVTGAIVQAVNIGTNTTGGSTSTVTIGSTIAGNITLQSAATIAIGNNAAAQTLNIGNSTGGTVINLQGGTGGINIGTANLGNTIQLGSTSLSTGTQAINIGTNGAAGTTNVVIGSTSAAGGGTTTLQARNTIVFNTNGTTRGTFSDTANTFYFGNGITSTAPNNFVIQGTGSTTTAVAGGNITLQGGNATVGNANGGNITLSGGTGFGTGVSGLTVLTTPSFQTVANTNCAASCNITQANIDSNGAVIVNATNTNLVITLTDPTILTAGRVVYITAANGSNDFTLRANTGGGVGIQQDIAMRQNTTATMIWNGSDWTAAGASSSTTLQSAYDSTLTSAGGAELLVSKTSNHDGLTIRDSSVAPVNGTLLEVQTATASSLFSVNGSVTDYANNGGAESTFGTEWPSTGFGTGVTVSRNTTTTYVAGGTGSVSIATTGTANTGGKNVLTAALTSNLQYNVSFAAKLTSGSASFTDLNVYYSIDGTTASTACINYSTQTVPTSIWAKINCTFTAPSSGITASNAILIRQTAGATRTWYVDNFSLTVSANLSLSTDGGVDDNTNFGTNWTTVGSTVTRSTTVGNDTSDSAQVVTTGANQGVRNKLSINPFASTLYRITAYSAATTAGFNTFTVRYSRDGGTNFVNCADYNTQAISSSTTSFTQVTCYITTDGTAATNPYVYFTQTDATGRTFYVDTFSMNISTGAVPNVQIGGGLYGGPVTLLTLDRSASAPIAANNDALLGSMYYDTTLGKLQCYESGGWGACGSSPDNIITISPEYTNAVLHGSGVGTMTSDICSSALAINDGSSSQPTICAATETYNFYKWTSPQASAQTYSIYVTYQLPSTFKSFASGQTSLLGRTDSANSTVQYSIYRSHAGSALVQCGSVITVSTGVQSSWISKTAAGAADPSTCNFAGSDSIVFKIDTIASSNANAYVSNLGFTYSNK